MFAKLKLYFQMRRFTRQRDLYRRMLQKAMGPGGDPHAIGTVDSVTVNADQVFRRMRVLEDFKQEITFTRYTSALAMRTPYRGVYSKALPLVKDLDAAWSAMYVNGPAQVDDVAVDRNREMTLDYFLTSDDDRVLKIDRIYLLLSSALSQVDALLADLSVNDVPRYQHYMYRYGSLFEDTINALEALVSVSDLNVAPH